MRGRGIVLLFALVVIAPRWSWAQSDDPSPPPTPDRPCDPASPTVKDWRACLENARIARQNAPTAKEVASAKERADEARAELTKADKAVDEARAEVDRRNAQLATHKNEAEETRVGLERDIAKATETARPGLRKKLQDHKDKTEAKTKQLEAAIAQATETLTSADATRARASKDWEQVDGSYRQLAKQSTDAEGAVKRLEAQLAALEKATSEEVQYAANDCADADVICLDHDGRPFYRELIPVEVSPGSTMTVKVFITTAQQKEETVAVAFAQRKSLDVPVEPPKPKPQDGQAAAEADRFDPAKSPDAFHVEAFKSSAIDDDSDELVISFASTRPGQKLERRYLLTVRHGYSYYSVALLIASVYHGDRTIRRDLTAFEDTAVEAAFALNVYPFGRRRGVVGFWRTCPTTRKELAKCAGRTVGLTLGTDIDLSKPFDRLYSGVVIEPVAGLAITAGFSLRQVEFVPPGTALPERGDDMSPIPVEHGRVLRPYIGVTLTLDILETLADFKRAAVGINF